MRILLKNPHAKSLLLLPCFLHTANTLPAFWVQRDRRALFEKSCRLLYSPLLIVLYLAMVVFVIQRYTGLKEWLGSLKIIFIATHSYNMVESYSLLKSGLGILFSGRRIISLSCMKLHLSS